MSAAASDALPAGKRRQVLDPIDRWSEVIFGLLMAVTFTGTISVATAGREEIRTVLYAALGCNLAWGLVDAVIYLVAVTTERTRGSTLLAQVRAATDPAVAHALIAEALPARIGAGAGPEVLEPIRRQLLAATDAPPRVLGRDDYLAAFGVFLVTVLATFPVAIPFLLFNTSSVAMRVSNAIAIVSLFVAGAALARYAGAKAWIGGAVMAALGCVLVVVVIALGG